MRSSLLAAGFAIAASGLLHAGFNQETGTAVFEHYSPKQYGASPQNWGVAEDGRGVLYFANTDGVLEFDGSTWRSIHLPGNAVARSIAVGQNGKVYVGGVGDLGYLAPDANGTTQFVSLKGRLAQSDQKFGYVLGVTATPRGIYFSTSSRLFRLNADGQFTTWRPQKKFGRTFYLLNNIYLQTAGSGLVKVGAKDLLEPVTGGDQLVDEAMNAAIVIGDEAVVASSTRLFRLTSGGLTLWPTDADPWLRSNIANCLLDMHGGELAVGSRKGGIALINPSGKLDRILSTATGLTDDYVSDIHRDKSGGVWLTLNNGITRVNPALSRFDAGEGMSGDVETVSRASGTIYAGTTAGVFRLKVVAPSRPVFEHVDGLSVTVSVLAERENTLLAGSDLGVFEISGLKAKNIFESTRPVYDLAFSRTEGDVYVARRTAVTLLRRRGSTWSKAAEFAAPGDEFRSVLEADDGRVWASTTNGAIFRFDFRTTPVKQERFGPAQGIPAGWVNVRRLDRDIVFTTSKGIKRYDETSKKFVPDERLGAQFAEGSRDVFNIFEDPSSGSVWVTGEKYHGLLTKQAGGYKWLPMPLLESGISEIYWMSIDPGGTVWATGSDFVLHRWERALAGNPDKDFRVLTRRVQLMSSQKDWYGGAGAFPKAQLPWHDHALRFEFAAPFYEQPSAVEYQVRLDGTDTDWTPWSHETKADYRNLPEGSYRLHVRARTPHGTVAEDSSLFFGVLPPWYRTWWAYSSYAVFGVFGIWGIVGLRTRQLQEDKRRLEFIVEERTVEVRKQRDEIQVEQEKSQSLLLNILPATVADELKTTGTVQPVGFDDVTVCFTDFVGFTVSSEKMQPDHLVDALNEYFTRFDEIVARYGLEKLKTIGDSYMFASGLPAARASHAVDAVLAALEMVEVVRELGAREGSTGWNIRVGLHSGPVVAGVVGTRKFAFDIWGNTVNFAARMESSGVPGQVNLSERTCGLTRGLIDCESRGHVKIKEGRELPMFLALGPARELLWSDAPEGIPTGFAARYHEEFGEHPRSFPARVLSQSVAATAGSQKGTA